MNGQEIKDLVIPENVTCITHNAFYGCSGLSSVNIHNSVTSIGSSAFYGCNGLTTVTIGYGLTSIGSDAFKNCSNLTAIIIPNSVTSIEQGAFYGTAWYNNQPDGLVYAGKIAYEYKGTMPSGTSITIKEGTIGITSDAFYNCSGLTSVTIPGSVQRIGPSAFSSCGNLTSVTIDGYGTKSIGSQAFYNCTNLITITIPSSVTKIGNRAFYGTAWYDNQPDGLVYAGKVAYRYKGTMPNETTITLDGSTVGIADYAFQDCKGLISDL